MANDSLNRNSLCPGNPGCFTSPAKVVKILSPEQSMRVALGAGAYTERSRSYRSDLKKIG